MVHYYRHQYRLMSANRDVQVLQNSFLASLNEWEERKAKDFARELSINQAANENNRKLFVSSLSP